MAMYYMTPFIMILYKDKTGGTEYRSMVARDWG